MSTNSVYRSCVTIEDVLEAADEIRPFIHRTPVVTSTTADDLASADSSGVAFQLVMKCENLQKVGGTRIFTIATPAPSRPSKLIVAGITHCTDLAFKIRGATNAIRSLLRESDPSKLTVVTHSSGNHAQALALAARQLGVRAHVVMPNNSSPVKKAAVRGYGAVVTECVPTLQAREDTARKVIEMESGQDGGRKVEFVPPYDDVRIIAGQGTIAVELLEQARGIDRPLDVIIAPVGGGGMISGVALTTKALSPGVWVVGAEPSGADDAFWSFQRKTFQPSVNPKTVADGLLTSTGKLTFPLILEHVDAIHTVSEEQIIRAMKFVWERMKLVIEPSAAVSLAVAMFSETFKEEMKERARNYERKCLNVGIVFSGGNVDLSVISELFERV